MTSEEEPLESVSASIPLCWSFGPCDIVACVQRVSAYEGIFTCQRDFWTPCCGWKPKWWVGSPMLDPKPSASTFEGSSPKPPPYGTLHGKFMKICLLFAVCNIFIEVSSTLSRLWTRWTPLILIVASNPTLLIMNTQSVRVIFPNDSMLHVNPIIYHPLSAYMFLIKDIVSWLFKAYEMSNLSCLIINQQGQALVDSIAVELGPFRHRWFTQKKWWCSRVMLV